MKEIFTNKLVLLSLLMVLAQSSIAQVTIGSGEAPISGALLQLKDQIGITAGSANATKGLALPRIQLRALSGDLAESMGHDVPGSLEADLHTALVVYNVTECIDGNRNGAGVYVWNGNKWVALMPDKEPAWTGSTITGKSGTEYKTLNFGTAGEWMLEDLKETEYDTNEVQNAILTQYGGTNINSPTARAFYFPSDTPPTGTVAQDRIWFDTHKEKGIGLYYTWGAATNGKYTDYFNTTPTHSYKTSYVQGLCPNGWVVPSDYDMTVLEKEMITNWQQYSTGPAPEPWDPDWWENNTLPIALAVRGTHGVNMKTPCVTPGFLNPSKGTSLPTGFNAMLNGYLDPDGAMNFPGTNMHIWSTSATGGDVAYYRYFNSNLAGYSDNGVGRALNSLNYMFNLRCKKSPDTRISTIRGKSGMTYKTADFGPAGVWMMENLAETEYDDGSADTTVETSNIPTNDSTTKAYYYPNNDKVWYEKNKQEGVGLLYTWAAASKGAASDDLPITGVGNTVKSTSQGLCPKGWVLPSDHDWSILEKEITENPTAYGDYVPASTVWDPAFNNSMGERGTHGRNMKSKNQIDGIALPTGGDSKLNGFNAKLVGLLHAHGTSSGFGEHIHLWSSTTVNSGSSGLYRYILHEGVGRTVQEKGLMFSVRCKKAN